MVSKSDAVFEGSVVATSVSRALDASSVVRFVQNARDAIRNGWIERRGNKLTDWWRSSDVARVISGVGTLLSTAGVTTGGRHLLRWGKSSFIYRWLTKEPEPDVIVIDLRETYSVGPVIAFLDRTLVRLIPITRSATVAGLLGDTERFVRRTPVRAAGLLVAGATMANILVGVATFSVTRTGLLVRFVVLMIALMGTQITISLSELLETTPMRLLVAALEPPEPEEWDGERDGRDDDRRE